MKLLGFNYFKIEYDENIYQSHFLLFAGTGGYQ